MFTFGFGKLVQLLLILTISFNVIFAMYPQAIKRRYPTISNTQRSADSGYKYAWFTRDIHEDNDDNTYEGEQLTPQSVFRLRMLQHLLKGKYQINDENSAESSDNF